MIIKENESERILIDACFREPDSLPLILDRCSRETLTSVITAKPFSDQGTIPGSAAD